MQITDNFIGKKMKLYKLTDKCGRTRPGYPNETFWSVGDHKVKTPVENPKLCSEDVFHAFLHPLLALNLFFALTDFDWSTMRLFEAEGVVVAQDKLFKVGVFELKITKEIEFNRDGSIKDLIESLGLNINLDEISYARGICCLSTNDLSERVDATEIN
jgi:hypothetical protein